MGDKVSTHTGKIISGFFNILFADRYRHILILHNGICTCCLIKQHLIVFPAILVPEILLHGHEDGLLKIGLVHPPVVDGNLRHRPGIQGIEKFRVDEEHTLLILAACHQIVNIRKAVGFGELVSGQKNTVRPDTADGDHILHLSGYGISFLVLLGHGFECLNHALPPSVYENVSVLWTDA